MTGPQHYEEAERLALLAIKDRDYPETAIAELAGVHATLALAAATALKEAHNLPTADRLQWFRIASEHERQKHER